MLNTADTKNSFDNDAPVGNWERLRKLPRPAWLKGELVGSKLEIIDPVITRTSRIFVLDLDIPLSDGSLLTSPSNEHWHQLTLEYTYFIRERGFAGITIASTHVYIIRRLLVLLQWLRQQGIMRLSAMTADHAEQFVNAITFGAGSALGLVDRLSKYFADMPLSELPTRRDRHFPARISLDIEAICRTLNIDFHSLSSDVRASYLLANKAKDIGYLRPNQEALLQRFSSLPPPNRLGNENLRRYLLTFEHLYRLREDIRSDPITFFPTVTLPPTSRKSKKKDAHTENIPPLIAMDLLDKSIRWILQYGPEVLDLLGALESEYKRLNHNACDRDSVSTPYMMRRLAKCTQLHLYLAEKTISERPDSTFALARHLLLDPYHFYDYMVDKNGAYNDNSELIRFARLSTNQHDGDFANIRAVIRQILRRNKRLNKELPRGVSSLARLIGSNDDTVRAFLKSGDNAPPAMLIRLRDYLIGAGWTILPRSVNPNSGETSTTWRMDAGIEQRLTDYLDRYVAKTAGPGAPWPINWNFAANSRGDGISLFEALTVHIPMSCLVVNGIFSARRKTSLTSLEAGCFVIDDNGFGYLHAFIEKTERAMTFVTCPELVGKSVNLLERWSSPARSLTGSPRLYQEKLPWSSVRIPQRINRDLNRFARRVGVHLGTFRLKVRQFRRFFAMTYMWRYKLGNLEALSYYLKHRTIGATYAYVTETVGGDVMLEVQSELTRHIYLGAIAGTNTSTGPLARRIKRYGEQVLGHIRSKLQMVSDEEIENHLTKHLDSLVSSSGRLLLPNPWGFCGCGNRSRDIAKAACARLKKEEGVLQKRPELSRISICANCPHLLTDSDFEPYWREKNRQLMASVNDPNLPAALRTLAAGELTRISRFMKLNFPSG